MSNVDLIIILVVLVLIIVFYLIPIIRMLIKKESKDNDE